MGALLIPCCAPSALFLSIWGDFEPPKVGLGTKKFGLESIVFADLSPFIIVDWLDEAVIRCEFLFFSNPVCEFAFEWTWEEAEAKFLSAN